MNVEKNDYDKLSELKTNLKDIIINQNFNGDKYRNICNNIIEIIKNKKILDKNFNNNNTMIEYIYISQEEKKVYNKKLNKINEIIFNFENKFCEINEEEYNYYTINLLCEYLKYFDIFYIKNIPKIMNKLVCLLKKNLKEKIFDDIKKIEKIFGIKKIETIEKNLILIKNTDEFKNFEESKLKFYELIENNLIEIFKILKEKKEKKDEIEINIEKNKNYNIMNSNSLWSDLNDQNFNENFDDYLNELNNEEKYYESEIEKKDNNNLFCYISEFNMKKLLFFKKVLDSLENTNSFVIKKSILKTILNSKTFISYIQNQININKNFCSIKNFDFFKNQIIYIGYNLNKNFLENIKYSDNLNKKLNKIIGVIFDELKKKYKNLFNKIYFNYS